MKKCGGVEDFEAHDLAVLPVQDDHRRDSLRRVKRHAVAARRQLIVGEIDVGSIHFWVIGDAHSTILLDPSRQRKRTEFIPAMIPTARLHRVYWQLVGLPT
jgi:hypothetical protein